MFNNPPHREASWYGPINKFISGHLEDHAMLKPQGPLSELASVIDPDPDASFHSDNSYGRKTAGRRGEKVAPDFLLCTFTASMTGDSLKAIIEVKHPGDIESAREDVAYYLDLNDDASVVGLAVAGLTVEVIVLDSSRSSGFKVVKKFNLLRENFTQYIYDLTQET